MTTLRSIFLIGGRLFANAAFVFAEAPAEEPIDFQPRGDCAWMCSGPGWCYSFCYEMIYP